jgi:hypothetical protein
MATGVEAQAVEAYDGFYFGAGAASQNVWGGSFVDGIDVLAQDRRTVVELTGGWRKQFGWFVAGIEVQLGFLDGQLTHTDPADTLSIHYDGNRQSGFGLTVGGVLGTRHPTLLFAYAFETTRNFDVVIQDGSRLLRQRDEQGFLRYGIGAETRLVGRVGLRGTVGAYRVDFGELTTNIDVGGEMEYTLAFVVQLGG